MKIILKVPWQK